MFWYLRRFYFIWNELSLCWAFWAFAINLKYSLNVWNTLIGHAPSLLGLSKLTCIDARTLVHLTFLTLPNLFFTLKWNGLSAHLVSLFLASIYLKYLKVDECLKNKSIWQFILSPTRALRPNSYPNCSSNGKTTLNEFDMDQAHRTHPMHRQHFKFIMMI